MKKLLALLLAVAMLASMATIVSAAELTTISTTTLTTTVQPASYTLNIPAEYKIDFGDTYENIGAVSISGATGFAEGKNVSVTVSYTEFTSEAVDTTIPFSLALVGTDWDGYSHKVDLASGDSFLFNGKSSGDVEEYNVQKYGKWGYEDYAEADMDGLTVSISSSAWGKALAGDYTATITFTAEVVAG